MFDLCCQRCLLCSITLPVFLCEVLQVVLVEVLITRRAENFLRQITDNCRGAGKKERMKRELTCSVFCLLRCLSGLCRLKKTKNGEEQKME